MKKTATFVMCCTLMGSALAETSSNSLNNVRINTKGVDLALVGSASIEVPNDEARMIWSVTVQADTLKEATAQAMAQMNEGIVILKKTDQEANLRTQNVNSYPVYTSGSSTQAPKIAGWRVTQSVALQTKDIKGVAELISTVNGTLELDQVTFSVSEKTRDSYEKTLIAMAIDDATKRAAYTANALGLNPKNVHLTDLAFDGTDTGTTNRVLMRSSAKMDYASVPVPNIEVGTTTLQMTVKANAVIRRK